MKKPKNKPLLRVEYDNISEMYVIFHCPIRWSGHIIYKNMDALIKDYPVTVFDIKIVECSIIPF